MQQNRPNLGLQYNASFQKYLENDIGLSDLEAIRLILSGDSIVDWNRANFRNKKEVDRFLHLHLIDLNIPIDRKRLYNLHQKAMEYLEEHLKIRFPLDLRKPKDIREIFLKASYDKGFDRRKILSCVILKLMHVLHHLDVAELRYRVPLAEAVILEEVKKKVLSMEAKMKEAQLPIVEFYGSRKKRNSIITKLLAKKEDVAATVFDKMRFRIITEDRKAIVPVLVWLQQNLFPYNYVIPGESHNSLLSYEELLAGNDFSIPPSNGNPDLQKKLENLNSFSDQSYRVINFIIDLPIKVDHLVEYSFTEELGRVLFAMVEFQVMDQETAIYNGKGDAAHELYKQRQQEQVLRRLKKGRKPQ
jgi:uncharacterized protein (TIGR04552 family)